MLLSGGIDSATCVQLSRKRYHVRTLTFEYHGIARRELEAARAIARAAGIVEHRFVRLPDLREAGDIRRTTFAEVPSTYIPMRNGIFYSLAGSYAEEVGADLIVGGHNKDDVRTFADAAPAFFDALEKAFRIGSPILMNRRTRILLPLSEKTKAQVVRLASSLEVPLGLTWSCHREGGSHCWECDGCRSRMEAFEKADVVDPLRDPGEEGKIS
ncbi:MAG: 7-cyano-7-deazaguanine synthase [Nitrososphaerales archaeon]